MILLSCSASCVSSSDVPPSDAELPSPFPLIPGLPVPDSAAEARLLAGLTHGRLVPFRATRGSGGLDGTNIRPGDTLTRPQMFAMFMDDVSSVIRKAWAVLWLPQIQRALALADEHKASAPDAREGERLSLKEKARTFARLLQEFRYFVNEVVQQYKPLQNKNFFKYFTEHVNAAVEFSLSFSLRLMPRPVSPVGDLAHLAYEEDKMNMTDVADSEPQILTPDGKLIPATPAVLQQRP